MSTAVTPPELVSLVAERLPGALVAFDVDGVLAPLVSHVSESAMAEGVVAALTSLASACQVALLSGRSLASIATLLEFPPGLHVIGSHGLEVLGRPAVQLDDDEQREYEVVTHLARQAAAASGPGAWVEYKPASVVLHTAEADGEQVHEAVAELIDRAPTAVKPGHHVVELLVRQTDKGTALLALGAELAATSLVFLGDDATDEDAFARMGADDISVRVGPGTTVARWRLQDSAAAARFAIGLAAAVDGRGISSPGRA